MKKLLGNFSAAALLVSFVAIAHAQEKVGAKFGDDFLGMEWQALLFILGYSALGSFWRLHQSIRMKEIVPSISEIGIFFLVGIACGFATHGLCEAANSLSAYRMNDWIQGLFIMVGAFSNRRLIDIFTNALMKNANKVLDVEKEAV